MIIVSFVLVAGYFHNNTFVLFLISTVLIYVIACLGLNIQFGFAGMLNFAGGAMLGIGGYAAALLGNTSIPTIAILPLGGLAAAVIGSILLPPMLRTRGHYSAVITIAFNLLFTTFLDAYEGLGGPQGLPVRGASLFSWSFNENIQIADFTIAFYANYITLGLAMVLALVALIRRMERSWIGLNLDFFGWMKRFQMLRHQSRRMENCGIHYRELHHWNGRHAVRDNAWLYRAQQFHIRILLDPSDDYPARGTRKHLGHCNHDCDNNRPAGKSCRSFRNTGYCFSRYW